MRAGSVSVVATNPARILAVRLGSCSAALNREDEWSDIYLALRLIADIDSITVCEPWTAYLYQAQHAIHHLDVRSGPTLFRVFLLADTLQVDLSFWPSERFAADGDAFELIFGAANPPTVTLPPAADGLVGTAWLYALHVRSAIARGRSWQADHMLNGLREQVIALACRRHGLPAYQGRGVDRLPPDLLAELAPTRVHSLDPAELARGFAALTRLLVLEVEQADPARRAHLEPTLMDLVASLDEEGKQPTSGPQQ